MRKNTGIQILGRSKEQKWFRLTERKSKRTHGIGSRTEKLLRKDRRIRKMRGNDSSRTRITGGGKS